MSLNLPNHLTPSKLQLRIAFAFIEVNPDATINNFLEHLTEKHSAMANTAPLVQLIAAFIEASTHPEDLQAHEKIRVQRSN